jgi:hypothetical protein
MRRAAIGILLTVTISAGSAGAQEEGQSDLAKQSQNPIGNLVSLPFQNNTSFGIGPEDAISNVLNIQPVYPVGLSKKWNLINRGIVPVIYQEAVFSEIGGSASGLGDISYTGFISPSQPGKWIWGVGPAFIFPSATEDRWASDKWSGGAGVVVLTMPGNWVLGALVQNVWSFAGDDDAEEVNQFLLQPIINFNLEKGWYLTSVPVITANWTASSSNRWTVPLGGGFGRIVKWGKQPLDLSMQAFYNVEKPTPRVAQGPNLENQGDTWTLRLQLKLLFPK